MTTLKPGDRVRIMCKLEIVDDYGCYLKQGTIDTLIRWDVGGGLVEVGNFPLSELYNVQLRHLERIEADE